MQPDQTISTDLKNLKVSVLVRKNHDLLRVVGLVRYNLIQLQNIKINSSGPFKTKIEENHIVLLYKT